MVYYVLYTIKKKAVGQEDSFGAVQCQGERALRSFAVLHEAQRMFGVALAPPSLFAPQAKPHQTLLRRGGLLGGKTRSQSCFRVSWLRKKGGSVRRAPTPTAEHMWQSDATRPLKLLSNSTTVVHNVYNIIAFVATAVLL